MGMSIYYTAKRGYALRPAELELVQAIADKYCAAYPFRGKHEDFCIYGEPSDELDVILRGATGIPYAAHLFYDTILYWLKCLTDITRAVSDCTWQVTLDDTALIWENDGGWRLPTDEEMQP